ncbi:MAG: GDYXXLXY domain-containing protein [Patescibacteria group bacterium]
MKKSYFIGLIVLQLVLLGFIAARYEYVLKTGVPMKVLVQAVDPLDYFRGQYVALSYPLSTWTGAVNETIIPGTRVYLSTSQTASGVTDKIKGLYAARSACPDQTCVSAKLTSVERHTTLLVSYTYKNGSGAIISRPNEEYTQIHYDYGYESMNSAQKFKEGEKVEVSIYDTKSGNIGGIYKYVDPKTQPQGSEYAMSLPKSDPSLPNGTILKILREESVVHLEFDANRFYVQE